MSLSTLHENFPITIHNFRSIIYEAREVENGSEYFVYGGQSRHVKRRVMEHRRGTTVFDTWLKKEGNFERVKWYLRWMLILSNNERRVQSTVEQAVLYGMCKYLLDINEGKLLQKKRREPRNKNNQKNGNDTSKGVEHRIWIVYKGLFRGK